MSTFTRIRKSFKLIVVGDAGVGKSTFIKRHRTGEFEQKYIETMGVEIWPIIFGTNRGKVVLNIWDCAGDEKFVGLRDNYFIGANAAIVMFDVTNQTSYNNVSKHVNAIRRVCEDIPIMLCGSKVDMRERVVRPADIKSDRMKLLGYNDISSRSNYNFEKPFLRILRELIDPNVMFAELQGIDYIQEERFFR